MDSEDKKFPDWGMVIDIPVSGLEFHGFGNENEIRRFVRRDPKTLEKKTFRGIGKSPRVESYVQNLRAACYERIKDLQIRDERTRQIEFPIDGNECPVRTDIYFLFDGTNPGRVKTIDWDNLVKATLDGIKKGPITKTLSWGLISDDRYSVGGLVYKCIGPLGKGDAVVIRIVRDGWRSLDEFAILRSSIGAFPPFRPEDRVAQAIQVVRKGGILGADGRALS